MLQRLEACFGERPEVGGLFSRFGRIPLCPVPLPPLGQSRLVGKLPGFPNIGSQFRQFSKGWKRVSGKVPRIGSGFWAGQWGSSPKKCRREVDLVAQGVVE